jgi:hypothetical protein
MKQWTRDIKKSSLFNGTIDKKNKYKKTTNDRVNIHLSSQVQKEACYILQRHQNLKIDCSAYDEHEK